MAFKLKLGLGLMALLLATIIRFIAVYSEGGMSIGYDWNEHTLRFHCLVAAFLFVFWMIIGPSDVVIEDNEEVEVGTADSSEPSEIGATGSGGSDADGGDGGD